MKDFEKKIRHVFYLIAEYGIKNTPLDFEEITKLTNEQRNLFITNVHKGFRQGQDVLVHELVKLHEYKADEKKKLKEARRQKKDSDSIQLIMNNQKLIDHRIAVFRHFSDFIAWQLMEGQYFIARRFFSGERYRPDLLTTNLESVLSVVKSLHEKSELNIALISDLTTFIDIGDILLFNGKEITVIEVKEGEVQKKVFDLINDLADEKIKIENIEFNPNQKFQKQVDRTIKQMVKSHKLKEFINNEAGEDPFSNTKVEVIENQHQDERYYELLMELMKKAKENNFAYGSIENIVFIAVYSGERLNIAKPLFEFVCEKTMKGKNYPKFDYIAQIHIPLKESLFYKPFGLDIFCDLLLGNIKILMTIDLENLIGLLNANGAKASWLSKKETHKLKETKEKKNMPFIFKNRAIKIEQSGKEVYLGDSFIIKILFDNIVPSSWVKTYI